MKLPKVAVAFTVIAFIGVGAFFAARLVSNEFFAEAQDDTAPALDLPPRATIDAAIDDERAKEPFSGELLGLYVAPSEDQVPDEFKAERCAGEATIVPYSAEAAGDMHLEIALPSRYVLQENDPDTAVSSCDGLVVSARRYYFGEQSPGLVPGLIIGRSVFIQTGYHKTPAERISVMEVGGRDAIVVAPLAVPGLPEGIMSSSAIYFPEPFGQTFIHANDMSLDELLEIGRIVAAELQQ